MQVDPSGVTAEANNDVDINIAAADSCGGDLLPAPGGDVATAPRLAKRAAGLAGCAARPGERGRQTGRQA